MVDIFEGMTTEAPDLPEIEDEGFYLVPPFEVLESSSSSNLRRYIVDGMSRSRQSPIFDLGHFYVLDPERSIWSKVTIREVQAAVLDWDGEVKVYRKSKDGDEEVPLRLSTTATKGAVEAAQVATHKPGAFDNAPPGIALADSCGNRCGMKMLAFFRNGWVPLFWELPQGITALCFFMVPEDAESPH